MTSRYKIKSLNGRGFAVFCGRKRVSTPSSSMSMAEQKMYALERRDKRAGRINRSCITCGESFPSDGPGNRMCKTCQANASEIFTGVV